MIREIWKDEAFRAQKAKPATADDLCVAQDLLETLEAHKDGCVGMAANMIGANKRIIAFDNGGTHMVLFNPEIVKCSGPYQAEEGCLSPVSYTHLAITGICNGIAAKGMHSVYSSYPACRTCRCGRTFSRRGITKSLSWTLRIF